MERSLKFCEFHNHQIEDTYNSYSHLEILKNSSIDSHYNDSQRWDIDVFFKFVYNNFTHDFLPETLNRPVLVE